MKNSDLLNDRYDRNFSFLTKKDQTFLLKSKVCIVGLGGLGGCVMEMLARTGIGHIIGIDHDKFESSNLNRQIFSSEDLIGEPKSKAAFKRLKNINSQISIQCINDKLDKTNAYNIIKNCDVVVDCLDSIKTRFVLEDAARKASVPVVSGAIAGASGQVTSIFPGDKGFELIYGDKKKIPDHGIEKQTGTLSFGVFFISSIQVSETIKILLKKDFILRNKLMIVDLWSNKFDIVNLV